MSLILNQLKVSNGITLSGSAGAQLNGNGSTLSLSTSGNWNSGVSSLIQLQSSSLLFWSNGGSYLFKNSAGNDIATLNSTNGSLQLSSLRATSAGNVSGGTILMGPQTSNAGKWSYLCGTHYDHATEPEGVALIGCSSTSGANEVTIGGSIYESNPATKITFYTHTAATHNLGGSPRMTIDSNGNVGIGVTAPDAKLEINGTVSVRGSNFLYFGQSSGSVSSWVTRMYASSGFHYINANGLIINNEGYATPITEFLRINSSGQLTINTAAISTFSKLNLGNTGIDLQVDATTTASTKMNANATNNVLAIRAPFSTNPSAAGNAGAKWGIWFSGGPSYDTVNYPYTSTEATTTSIGKSAAIYAVSEDSAAGYNRQIGLAFYTSNFDANMGERVRIDRAGNVGIGTTSPTTNVKLDVVGNIGIQSENSLRLYSSTNYSRIYASSSLGLVINGRFNGSFYNMVITAGSSGTAVLYALTDGRVNIDPDGYGTICSGTISDAYGNLRTLPENAKSAAYTLAASDTGRLINITTGGITVPASVFSIGQVVTIYNNSASNQTITQGASVTMYLAGTATTGNRTLAQRGVATVICVASNTFVISGSGLT